MTLEGDGEAQMYVPADETPIPHEANHLAPGVISELDARASFDKLMRFATRRADRSRASYVQGVIMAYQELGWDTALWSDPD